MKTQLFITYDYLLKIKLIISLFMFFFNKFCIMRDNDQNIHNFFILISHLINTIIFNIK